MNEIHTGRFYRIGGALNPYPGIITGTIIFCKRYTLTLQKDGSSTIQIEGIRPEDYAAYVTHHYLAKVGEDYRYIAEIEHIPFPDAVEIECSADARIEEISKEDAFREWKAKKEQEIVTSR